MTASLELASGETVALDEHGHLAARSDWSQQVAREMASRDGIELDAVRLKVMALLTAHYDAYGVEMPMRLLVRRLGESGFEDHASSRALYRLFPEGPVRQGSRYAGLPIPVSCI